MPDDNTLRVAALGASAGGLDAFRTLLSALPADTGMAFILVQHLDPAHASMMVSLLAGYTSMGMVEAGDGMHIEPNRIYVIPPGRYLSVADSTLHLSPVGGGRARMPFDFLLESLAGAYGSHAICTILTGTGSDGGVGAQSIREKGGLVIAQDPDEAQFDGMPRSAIAAGVVDFILPIARIPEALVHFARQGVVPFESGRDPFPPESAFARILALLRTQTAHDFDLHKRGTLMRRIERRMLLAKITDPEQYLALLQKDPTEVRNLVDDLFINVTSFFRDTAAFDLLSDQIIPDLVSKQRTTSRSGRGSPGAAPARKRTRSPWFSPRRSPPPSPASSSPSLPPTSTWKRSPSRGTASTLRRSRRMSRRHDLPVSLSRKTKAIGFRACCATWWFSRCTIF
jgi:two-component system, chemotaxis family, CheB/CheR fusion protein